MPKLPTIAELGVLRGDHAAAMIAHHRPDSIHLVDTWSAATMRAVYSERGTALPYVTAFETYAEYFGGNPFEQATWDALLRTVEHRFSGDAGVHIIKSVTHLAAERYEDAFFDLIYVDAGHPYTSVLYDLFGWQAKLKPDGFFVLNDCASSPETRSQNAGVLEAASTFVKATAFRPIALSSDVGADLVLSRNPASSGAQYLRHQLLIQNPSTTIELPDEALFSFNHKAVASTDTATTISLPSFAL